MSRFCNKYAIILIERKVLHHYVDLGVFEYRVRNIPVWDIKMTALSLCIYSAGT